MTKNLVMTAALALTLGTAACSTDSTDSTDAAVSTSTQDTVQERADAASETAHGLGSEIASQVVEFVADEDGGAAVYVMHEGFDHQIAAGAANDAGDPLKPDQAFRVGSISKSFVSVMVLQMVDEGSVALDEPLSTYLPETTVGADTTIRDLLSHRSGLPNYTDQALFFVQVASDPSHEYMPDEILADVADAEPGPVGEYAYSNTNYVLLGQLVEAIDETDLNSALAARVTEPLGLSETFFETAQTETPDNLVGGWSGFFLGGDPTEEFLSVASSSWAAGALISTPQDLAVFLESLFADELISAEMLTEMTSDETYGFGILPVVFSADSTGFGHGGAVPGYLSFMAIAPQTGDIVVALTNNDSLNADQLAAEIMPLLE